MNRKIYYVWDEKIVEHIEPMEKCDHEAYEVIRILDGKILFLEDHVKRLNRSLNLIKVNQHYEAAYWESQINQLKSYYPESNFNVKVVLYINQQKIDHFTITPVFPVYPSKELYEKGIEVVTLKKERKNPNAKIWDYDYKAAVENLLKETGAYEAILINDKDEVTEGSRSNMFFILEGELWTAPDEAVLKGVTRDKVLELAERMGLVVRKAFLSTAQLEKIEGAFMTGTSVHILPISRIDKKMINSLECPLLADLRREFEANLKG